MTYKNTFQRGIPADEAVGAIPLEVGVPTTLGEPIVSDADIAAQSKFQGIPMPGPGMVPDAEDMPAAKCVATTKKGNPCQAYAMTDSVLCVGHND